ncbi:hypothetical protein L1049_010460 [Liquidambar formosana]|uniref:Uncharacterized protein n=1 Tax=Liquidambar formosana TaxID=63359 RepID=A0AAP0R747_LIQFO
MLRSHAAGHLSPELANQSTPPAEQPKPKSRKRKQLFEESTVLSNKYEEAYSESSVAQSQDPVPDLDMETERLRQYEADASSNVLPHFAPSPPAFMPSPRVAHSGDPVPDLDVEIEHLRQYEADASSNVLPQLVPLPSAFMPTSFRRGLHSHLRQQFRVRIGGPGWNNYWDCCAAYTCSGSIY